MPVCLESAARVGYLYKALSPTIEIDSRASFFSKCQQRITALAIDDSGDEHTPKGDIKAMFDNGGSHRRALRFSLSIIHGQRCIHQILGIYLRIIQASSSQRPSIVCLFFFFFFFFFFVWGGGGGGGGNCRFTIDAEPKLSDS